MGGAGGGSRVGRGRDADAGGWVGEGIKWEFENNRGVKDDIMIKREVDFKTFELRTFELRTLEIIAFEIRTFLAQNI